MYHKYAAELEGFLNDSPGKENTLASMNGSRNLDVYNKIGVLRS